MRTTFGPAARRATLSIAGVAALASTGIAMATQADAQTLPAHSAVSWARACALPTSVGQMACNALHVTSIAEHVAAKGVTPNATPSGYGPSDLYGAYNLPANGGAGETVAIIDAYNDQHAAADMAVYRTQYGLRQ